MGGGDGMAERTASSPLLAAPGERDESLATKVNIPRTRPDRLARARLFQRLDEGMGLALVLVCTPAGFGKTTLLADWAAEATMPAACCRWIQTTMTRPASGTTRSRRLTR
jgi:hypothetical protein